MCWIVGQPAIIVDWTPIVQGKFSSLRDQLGLNVVVNLIPSLTRCVCEKEPPSLVFGQLDPVFTFYRSDPLTDIFPIHSFRPFPNDSILPSSSFSASKLSLAQTTPLKGKNIGGCQQLVAQMIPTTCGNYFA